MFAPVHLFGEGEDREEDRRKNQAAHGGHRLGEQIHDRGGEQNHPDRGQSDGDLDPKQVKVGRHLPVAHSLVAVAQHQHGDGFEDETPDHAEGIRFTQGVDVAPADDDGEELQSNDEIDDAIGGAVALVRTTEPIGEHAVFRDAIEHAIRADDGGVDRARENQESDNHDEGAEGQAHDLRADHMHGEAGDQVVAVHLHADVVRDQHDREQRDEAGEDEAINADDDGGALQVLKFRVRQFAIDLCQRFFAAHRQDGVSKAYDEAENAEHVRQLAVFPEAERFFAVVDIGESGEWGQVAADLQQGEPGPAEQHHHHDGRDLHDPERLLAGLLDTLDVLPPEVERDRHGEHDCGGIDADLRRAVEQAVNGGRDPAPGVGDDDGVVDQARDVLPRGNAGDRTSQYVIEHQGGDAELGEGAAEGFLDHTIDAAPHEHRAAFHVDGSDREGKQHNAQHEPGRALANRLFGDAAGVKGGRTQVVENDGGGSPVGDEGEHHRGRYHDANPVVAGWCV